MDNDMFEIDLENINVEDIMRQIREKIKSQGIIDEEIDMNTTIEEHERISDYLSMTNATCSVIADKQITSHRKFIGKIIVFIKRTIRKSIHWYTYPVVEQQNEFNSYATRTLNAMNKHIEILNSRIAELEKEIEKEKKEKNEKMDFDYLKFEDKYRGTQEEIKNRLNSYTEYFQGKTNILDIGCGRGEFLELLKEKNICAKGIDIEEDMILMCIQKGLDVKNIDALEYLNSLEDNSLGGIIMNQVIEHMEPKYLCKLIKVAHKKLQEGAYIVTETINPQSLIVFTEAYFMDPSHNRMIHPYTIQFLLENDEFKDVSIKYMNKVEDLLIPQSADFPEGFNKAINKLNDVVYGYRDYAVIGRK